MTMKVAIITGASRGFGREVAKALVSAEWAVVVDGRDEIALSGAASEFAELAGYAERVRAIAGDVADPEHRHRLASVAAELGRLDLLVNNASVLGPSPQPKLADYPLDVLADVYRVNTIAPVGLIQETLEALRASKGVIVNVTSDAGVEGYEGWGGYGSSKAALEQVSNVLAAEEPDVAVYWFDPGDMRTQMHQEAFPGEDISDRPEPATIVPALLRLLERRPASGRYRASDVTP